MEESVSGIKLSDKSSKNLTKITVHFCDKLKVAHQLAQPVVFIHVVNSSHGSYIKKQDKNKPAVSFYETQRGDVDYILPVMTHPCSPKEVRPQELKWEESFVLNEDLEYLTKKESNTIVFFEIADLVPAFVTKDNYEQMNENGMKKLAWSFLKLVGSNGSINIGCKLRLQLYKAFPSPKKKKNSEVEVFQWWHKGSKTPLQASSIYVSIEPHELTFVEPALRSMLPLQEETNVLSTEKLASLTISSSSPLKISNNSASSKAVVWSRKEGEPCKVPTQNSLSLNVAHSCQILNFSCSGRLLLVGSGASNQYFISIYEIPSGSFLLKKLAHSDLIYDIDWCKEDSYVLTASADYSAKLWCVQPWEVKASFVHPSFVYAAKFQPNSKNIVCTSCYDHVLRIWTYNQSVQLLRELEGHNGAVYTFCWLPKVPKLVSGDSNGQLNIWKNLSALKHEPLREAAAEGYILEKELNLPEIKITSIDRIICNNQNDLIFLFCGDNIVRLVNYVNENIVFRYKGSIKTKNYLSGCCSPCGNLFFLSNQDGSISVWNIAQNRIDSVLANTLHPYQLSSIDYHPFENMIAVSSMEENVPVHTYIYDQKDKSEVVNEDSNISAHQQESKSSPHQIKNKLCNKYNTEISLTTKKKSKHDRNKSNPRKYSSDSSSIGKSLGLSTFQNSRGNTKKNETFSSVIAPSSQYDVITATDNSTKSDDQGSQSSVSALPQIMQNSAKRAERRRKLQELNKN